MKETHSGKRFVRLFAGLNRPLRRIFLSLRNGSTLLIVFKQAQRLLGVRFFLLSYVAEAQTRWSPYS